MENEKDAVLFLDQLAKMWGMGEPQYNKTLLLDETRTTAKGNVMSVKVTHYAEVDGAGGFFKVSYEVEERFKLDGAPILDFWGNPFPYYRHGEYDLPTEAEAREAAERILSGDLTQTPENPCWKNPDYVPFEI